MLKKMRKSVMKITNNENTMKISIILINKIGVRD